MPPFALLAVFFSSARTERSEKVFTHTGFRDWKHAAGKTGKLEKHNQCFSHKISMISWKEYTTGIENRTTIADRLDSVRSKRREENRHYIRTVAEVILLCARQNVALRGHRESQLSLNKGEILDMISNHDEIVKRRLQGGPRNAMYTSPGIQNTILSLLGGMVRKEICDGVTNAEVFSLLVDESKDISKKEQISFVLRYVDVHGVICEHFLTFAEATSLNAEGLAKNILEVLAKFELPLDCLVSQGYDGASVMSGSCSGVQKRIQDAAPQAVYVHCFAHTLNLVLVDSVRAIPSANEFFLLLESLYVFISTTKAHVVFMEQQSKLHPDTQPLQLQRLSDTRWACRYGAVNSICRTYDSLLTTLEEISGSSDSKGIQAKGLYLQVKTYSFVLHWLFLTEFCHLQNLYLTSCKVLTLI